MTAFVTDSFTGTPAPITLLPSPATQETYSRDANGNLTGKTVTPMQQHNMLGNLVAASVEVTARLPARQTEITHERDERGSIVRSVSTERDT